MKSQAGEGRRWGTFVEVKTNFVPCLLRELRRTRRGSVMLASVTDAYQPAEQKFGLTRECLELLRESELEVGILTKSDLVVRDLDLISCLPRVSVGFSLTAADDALARLLEPGAPPTSCRLRALQALARRGVCTWIFVAPVIPGLTDTPENLSRLIRAAYAAGAQSVSYDPLNPYPSAVTNLERLLGRHFPRRLEAFRAALRDPGAYRRRLRRLWNQICPS
jgi:DNA repair photolyase